MHRLKCFFACYGETCSSRAGNGEVILVRSVSYKPVGVGEHKPINLCKIFQNSTSSIDYDVDLWYNNYHYNWIFSWMDSKECPKLFNR